MRKKVFSLLLLLSTLGLNAEDIYATFNVEAVKQATLAFTAGGTVTSIAVDVGSVVKKGQLLATLADEEQVAQLKLAQNDALTADIQAKQSMNSYARYKKVKDIMDAEKFEQIDFAAQMAEVNAKKAMRNVELRQAQLNKTRLTAPFNGVITARLKEVGDSVSGAQPQAFFELMDLSNVKLIVTFDEKYVNSVKAGDTLHYYVDGTQAQLEGTLSKIYPSIDARSRKVTAEVLTKDIMPGLFGHGIIKVK